MDETRREVGTICAASIASLLPLADGFIVGSSLKSGKVDSLVDRQKVVELVDQALALGYKPSNPHERLPFIEAYAHVGNWPEALRQTRKAFEKNARYATQLCYLWGRIDKDLELPPEFGEELADLYQQMQCQLEISNLIIL